MTNSNDSVLCVGNMEGHNGLTKREFFAALAMAGCLASCPEGMRWRDTILPFKEWAKSSLAMADALIAQLNKEKP